ncbi:MAG: L,D-transpeptidase family protein [Thermoanaerobaculaceae bacterium]
MAILATSCGPRPVPLAVEAARSRAAAAVAELRTHDPRKARLLEQLIGEAERITAFERHALPWDHSPGRTEAAWLRVTRLASTSLRDSRGQLQKERESFQALLVKALAELAQAQQELKETGMGRRETAAFQRAQGAVRRAEAFARLERWQAATDLLRGAMADCVVVHKTFLSLHARFAEPSLRRQWRAWVEETLEESRQNGSVAIIVDKLRRRLMVFERGTLLAWFPAELGINGLRPKQHSGDRATPEGRYRVIAKKAGAATKYHKALLINYPNEEDRQRFFEFKRRGIIPYRAGIGGLIEIHGDGGEGRDWTDGCVALRNNDMDKVFHFAEVGTPVTIVGVYER